MTESSGSMSLLLRWTTIFVALVAILGGLYIQNQSGNQIHDDDSDAADQDKRITNNNNNNKKKSRIVYAIGDLHGDVQCAKEWVQRTNLIQNFDTSNNNNPTEWIWKDDRTSLVFVGDYIDKGPTSRQTVEFIMALTNRFPNHITALMGNHELELLLDRDPNRMPHSYFQLSSGTVHPAEYLNYYENENDDDIDDDLVVDLLYNASIEVYGYNADRHVLFLPQSLPTLKSVTPIVDLIQPPSLRSLVSKRLASFQKSYVNAYRSNTSMGQWLEQLSVVHLTEDGTLFVHGGISPRAAQFLSNGREDIDRLNAIVRKNTHEDAFFKFMTTTHIGTIVDEMLKFRGNHPSSSSSSSSCTHIDSLLQQMNGVQRIAVGHTPAKTIRLSCHNQFLAIDSLLGRWIRSTGNKFCRDGRVSSNGRYRCKPFHNQCMGQIVKLVDGDVVHVIDSSH